MQEFQSFFQMIYLFSFKYVAKIFFYSTGRVVQKALDKLVNGYY